MSAALYHQRRIALLSQFTGDCALLIPSANEVTRNADTHYPFRQNSDFYYLTGFNEPQSVLVLIRRANQIQHLLFNRPRDKIMEIWNGRRAGQLGAVEQYGFDEAFEIDLLDQKLPEYLNGLESLIYPIAIDQEFDARVLGWIQQLRQQVRKGYQAPNQLLDVHHALHEMRLIKSTEELVLMREAANISAKAHNLAMQHCRVGQYEYQLESILLGHFIQHGARYPAYESIVATGENTCILHYTANNAPIQDGDLILIDAGAELGGYAADITRTFPANGQFSAEQRALYEVVLAAQLAAIEKVTPQHCFEDYHHAAVRVLTQGLVDLGLLQGSVDGLIEQNAYNRFYMHRTGHWLGMDVHDVGAYKIDGQSRRLQNNMVVTVEPGLYISAEHLDIDPRWHNIGIRIEDDVVVNNHTPEIITAQAVKSVTAIEQLMASLR